MIVARSRSLLDLRRCSRTSSVISLPRFLRSSMQLSSKIISKRVSGTAALICANRSACSAVSVNNATESLFERIHSICAAEEVS